MIWSGDILRPICMHAAAISAWNPKNLIVLTISFQQLLSGVPQGKDHSEGIGQRIKRISRGISCRVPNWRELSLWNLGGKSHPIDADWKREREDIEREQRSFLLGICLTALTIFDSISITQCPRKISVSLAAALSYVYMDIAWTSDLFLTGFWPKVARA